MIQLSKSCRLEMNHWDLIIRKLNGEASAEELDQLDAYFLEYPEAYVVFRYLLEWKQSKEIFDSQLTQKAYSRIRSVLNKEVSNEFSRKFKSNDLWITNTNVLSTHTFRFINKSFMLRNYFIIAWRNISRQIGFSALNILGLATGMAVALLIGLWVFYQFSYDRFLPGHEQAYSVKTKYHYDGKIGVGSATPIPLAEAIKKEIPGVKYVTQTDWIGPHSLIVGDKKIYQPGVYAGGDFFKIFQYPFLKGNPEVVLKNPYSIVLTESLAKTLFGNENPVGKSIRFDNSNDLIVSGVMNDVPKNATFQFKYVVPFDYMVQNFDWVKNILTNWRDNSFQTFISLEPDVSISEVETKISSLRKKNNPEDFASLKLLSILHPMKDWHLYGDFKNGVAGGFIDYVKMFSIIGFLVLLIACINFMNLSTARYEKRAREVGVRKAIGSSRSDLIMQFLSESLFTTIIAFIISILIIQLVLPAFNSLTKTSISIPFDNYIFWCIMAGYVLITGLLSGSRSAFYLSSFHPAKVLKGSIHAGRFATLPRKVLVVLQFSCSIALIISTIIIYQQIQHAKSRPVGYDANRLMMSDVSNEMAGNYEALKNDLLRSGVITSVTKSSSPVTDIWSNQRIDDWEGKLPGESLGLATIAVSDADYFKTIGMQFKEGRNFTGNLRTDSLDVILNEAAVERMRYKEPINQIITWKDVPQRIRVIGVVKNTLMKSPFSPAEPTIFIFDPGWASIITYRLSPTIDVSKAIATITPLFNKYNPSYPYTYSFVDEKYAAKFSQETLIGKLAGIFAALAIFISCLGLFGLAAYMAERRTKEIGIRKVLGASVTQVWMLLSKDFVRLVCLSCIIASPIAFYFLQSWLEKYEYRITIGADVFIVSAILAILITVITISFQAIKAAIANPVRSLKTE